MVGASDVSDHLPVSGELDSYTGQHGFRKIDLKIFCVISLASALHKDDKLLRQISSGRGVWCVFFS